MTNPINRVHRADIVNEIDFGESFKHSFAEIVDKDSPGKKFGFTGDILAMRSVDMDAVELARTGQLDKTMDCCIGIATLEPHSREYSAHKLLLVELKLNAKNHNVRQNDYKGKISHSRDILREYPLHPKNIFIFTKQVCGKAKRDLAGWCRGGGAGDLKTVTVLAPEEFNNFVGFEHQFEQLPLTNPEDIISSVENCSQLSDELMDVIETWKAKANGFRLQYNVKEAVHIENTLRNAVMGIISGIENE